MSSGAKGYHILIKFPPRPSFASASVKKNLFPHFYAQEAGVSGGCQCVCRGGGKSSGKEEKFDYAYMRTPVLVLGVEMAACGLACAFQASKRERVTFRAGRTERELRGGRQSECEWDKLDNDPPRFATISRIPREAGRG
ncbi:hypothetical protein ZHAS_00010732 [Anopheles sinensis]|uniref:Uncharacterized protein n=1 Tax=Anopheles sinensis TaxID=74873 RepID=A0A084VYL2_ANOSI|nr:hypothetical protein ZHAS_00010732 [Anopheles sinensis]